MISGFRIHSNTRRVIFALACIASLASWQSKAFAQSFFYRFTPIADTQPRFPYVNLTLFPCQNNADVVAFDATLTGGVQGMFSRHDLGGVDSILDTGTSPYESIFDCSINNNGLVLFSALQKLPNEYAQVLFLNGGGNGLLTLLTAKADGTYALFHAYQLNAQGKAVTLADKADGSGSVILTNGPLTGITKIIADTSPSSPYTGLFDFPSINGFNSVAFTAQRRDGSVAIMKIDDNGSGTVTALIDNTGPFAGFDDLDLNDNGSLAFDGHQWGGLGGVWRIDNNGSGTSITKITDGNATGSSDFTAVSINDSGQVAYSFSDELTQQTSSVGIGNGGRRFIFGPGPIVAGPGSVILGDFVSSAHIGRDSLNNLGQIVLEIEFLDRTPLIARADPVNPFQNIVASTAGAFALSTGNGSGAGVHTGVTLPLKLQMLDFDVTFLTKHGELKVMLGDRLLTTIPASSRGIRQSIRIPIDLREKTRRTTPRGQQLSFQLTGAPGAVVHIGNVRLPGLRIPLTPADAAARWHFDRKSGGWAGFVDDTRFPVQIKVLSEKPEQDVTKAAHSISVAILSTTSFDATKDIERETLQFGGLRVHVETGPNEGNRPECSERDVNGDHHPDLVCEFGATDGKLPGSPSKPAELQGMTPYGWMIEGRVD